MLGFSEMNGDSVRIMRMGRREIKRVAEEPFEEIAEYLASKILVDAREKQMDIDPVSHSADFSLNKPAQLPHFLAEVDAYWDSEGLKKLVPEIAKESGTVVPEGNIKSFKFDFRKVIGTRDFSVSDMERTNLDVKKAFNDALDSHIRSAIYFAQISEDYDILCDLPADSPLIPFDNKELINDYGAIGQRRMQAFQEALKRNGGKGSVKDSTVIELFLRVFKKDGVPYALKNASKLTNSGITVRNYDEGEKLIYIENLPSLEEPGFFDLEGKKQRKRAVETATVGTIRRTYYRDERTTTEVPQRHAEFSAYLITGWPSLNRYVADHFNGIRESHEPETKQKLDEALRQYFSITV